MAVKRNVNTEPDDAFSAVFGDIDQTPLMRRSGEETKAAAKGPEAPEEEYATEDLDLEAFEDQEPEEAGDLGLEGVEDQGLEEDETADDPVSIEVEEQDGAQTIVPSGDLKGEAPGNLMAVFLGSLEKDLARHRLDLKNVGAVDASGLSALVYFAQALKSRDQGLEIINANQDLQNLFSAGRLDKTYAVSFS